MKIASSGILVLLYSVFLTKFPSNRKSTSYTPRKKNLTMESKTNPLKMYLLLNMMIFHCHVSSSVGEYWFTPSIHATVQIPSSRDLRLEYWIHACAIQDISGRLPKGSSWDTLHSKIPQKAQSKETKIGNNFMQRILFLFRTLFLSAGFAETSASFQTIATILHRPALLRICLTFIINCDFLLLAWKILYQHSMVRYG